MSAYLSSKRIVSNEFIVKMVWFLQQFCFVFLIFLLFLHYFCFFLCGSAFLQVSVLVFAKPGTLSCFSESRHGNITSSTSISEIRSCLRIESKQTAGILAQGTVGHGLYTNCSCLSLCGWINFPLYLGTYEMTSPYLQNTHSQ